MKNYDQSVEINHNPNWLYIPDYPHRIVITGGSGSGKTNALLNFIYKKRQPDSDKIYLYISKIHSNQSINCLLTKKKN